MKSTGLVKKVKDKVALASAVGYCTMSQLMMQAYAADDSGIVDDSKGVLTGVADMVMNGVIALITIKALVCVVQVFMKKASAAEGDAHEESESRKSTSSAFAWVVAAIVTIAIKSIISGYIANISSKF